MFSTKRNLYVDTSQEVSFVNVLIQCFNVIISKHHNIFMLYVLRTNTEFVVSVSLVLFWLNEWIAQSSSSKIITRLRISFARTPIYILQYISTCATSMRIYFTNGACVFAPCLVNEHIIITLLHETSFILVALYEGNRPSTRDPPPPHTHTYTYTHTHTHTHTHTQRPLKSFDGSVLVSLNIGKHSRLAGDVRRYGWGLLGMWDTHARSFQ